MPHKAEGRREPKPWAAGLLKFSIILFAMIPLYFFMGGFFTPYMATGAAREIGVCMPDVLLVLLVLTVVALGSLGGGLRGFHERGWLGLAGGGLIAAAMSLILLDASEGRGCDVALFKVALLVAALGFTLLGLSLFRLGVLLLSPLLIAGGLMMTVPFLVTFIPAVYDGFAKAPGHPLAAIAGLLLSSTNIAATGLLMFLWDSLGLVFSYTGLTRLRRRRVLVKVVSKE
jgi:hypothetical protein